MTSVILPGGPAGPVRRWAARSLTNLKETFALARARYKRRSPGHCRWPAALQPSTCAFPTACLLSVITACFFADAVVSAYLRHKSPHLTAAARAVTDIGLSGWYLIPAAFVLVVANLTDWRSLSRRTRCFAQDWTCLAFLVLLSVGGVGIVVTLLKMLFGRARPRLYDQFGAYAFQPFGFDSAFTSFPSGHSTTVGAVAGLFALFFPRLRVVIVPLAVVLVLSRVAVGAHYPSDVVAGLALGWAFAWLAAAIFARLGFVFAVNEHGALRTRRALQLLPKR